MTDVAAPKRTTLQALAAFGERRSLCMLGLGFAAGMPNLLIFDTLSGWLNDEGVKISVIAFFSLATLAYSLKFIWAPLIDRTSVPFLTPIFGHRRSWMLVAQAGVLFGLFLMSGSDPSAHLGRVALFAVFVGFSGATQDIVIDAWRIEVAPVDRQGVMATAYQWGYKLASVGAGWLALELSDRIGWNQSYLVMTALMGLGVLSALLAPREVEHTIRPIPVGDVPSRPVLEYAEWAVRLFLILIVALVIGSGLTASLDLATNILRPLGLSTATADAWKAAWIAKPGGAYLQVAAVFIGLAGLTLTCWPLPRVKTRPGAYLAGSFGVPLKDFFTRFGGLAAYILALICFYRLADFVLNIMLPFYQQLGFENDTIGEVRKIFGIAPSLVGIFVGGLSVMRLGLIRTMVIGAFASPLSNLIFAWLAVQGPQLPALYVAIAVDNFATGFAGTALIAYMSSLTSVGFTATQYALFSSLYAFPGKLIASQSGRIVESAAHSAQADGPPSVFLGWFSKLPPISFAEAAGKINVTPAAMGAGYVTFFVYSTAIGVFAVLLAFWVAPRHKKLLDEHAAPVAAEHPA